jgi:hypothetical protein
MTTHNAPLFQKILLCHSIKSLNLLLGSDALEKVVEKIALCNAVIEI